MFHFRFNSSSNEQRIKKKLEKNGMNEFCKEKKKHTMFSYADVDDDDDDKRLFFSLKNE